MKEKRDKSGRPGRRLPYWLKGVMGAMVGGALGLGVYFVIGCPTGYCPMTSNWMVSTAYGGALGAILGISG